MPLVATYHTGGDTDLVMARINYRFGWGGGVPVAAEVLIELSISSNSSPGIARAFCYNQSANASRCVTFVAVAMSV